MNKILINKIDDTKIKEMLSDVKLPAFRLRQIRNWLYKCVNFDDMRNCKNGDLFFYCCSRIEKVMPDGTITRFRDYPWKESDEIIVDGLCPWHQYYYTPTPPFYHRYAGPVQHRLVKLNRNATK